MNRFAAFLSALALLAPAAWTQHVIRLKTRAFEPARRLPAGTRSAKRHLLLEFAAYPGPEVREELARRGIRVLDYVPENTLMAAVPARASLAGLPLLWVGPLEAADKISPLLATDTADSYLVVLARDADRQGVRRWVTEAGLEIVDNEGLLSNHLLVSGARDAVAGLAALDDVTYILPGDRKLRFGKPIYACPGGFNAAGAVADYALQGTGWPKDAGGGVALGYFFETLTPRLPENTVRSEIGRALAEWSRYTNVDFSLAAVQGAARSIEILFASRAHGDAYPFDGSGGVLAHTFYPAPANPESIAGDMHFDNDEAWSVGGNIDLYSVALHEIGHALGVGHSDLPSAVMYPYYHAHTDLMDDDIAAVQALYGVRGSSSPAPPASPPKSPDPPATPKPPSSPTPPATPPAGSDTVAPSLSIQSPATTILSTLAASIVVTGTASDNVAVTSVSWSSSAGPSGTAVGTSSWQATVPLLVGDNTLVIRAYDAAGNSGWRSVMVVRH
jgi:hypothetical protein